MKMQNNDSDYIETFKIYKQAIDEANIAVWEWNPKENMFFASNTLKRITQYDINACNSLFEFIDKTAIHEDRESATNDLSFFMEGKVSSYRSEFRIVIKGNQIKWILFKGNMIKGENGEVVRLVGIASDITEEKDSKKTFTEGVYYDSLTKLPNRDLFLMDIKNAFDNNINLNQEGAIIFVDLDNFKSINDTLGHDHGDLILKVFSQLLNICVKDYGNLYRIGGDEFIVLIEKYNCIEKLKKICNRILDYCKKPFELDEKQLYMTTSIGISIFPQDICDSNDLLKFAELAMYESKARGKNTYTFFEQALSESYTRRILIENELKESIKKNELFIVYQPQIDALENRIVGFEALLRWNNKKLGFISPAEFIPIAERTGMILDIGDWVLNKVCKKIREFKDKKYKFDSVSINVSPIQIKGTNFKDKIINVCNSYSAE